jgi:hypothetical protein
MFHKCINCRKRDPIVYVNSLPTLGGTVKLRYCSECNEKRLYQEKEREERSAKEWELGQNERQKQRRYEYLKREVELLELEEKAKKLGID